MALLSNASRPDLEAWCTKTERVSVVMRADISTDTEDEDATATPLADQGLCCRRYKEGDASGWAELEAAVGEFATPTEAMSCFESTFLCDVAATEQRCYFLEVKSTGKLIATASAWLRDTPAGYPTPLSKDKVPSVHWVSVHPEYQGKGLAKIIVQQVMKHHRNDGWKEVFLWSSSRSVRAIYMYYKAFGFRPFRRYTSYAEDTTAWTMIEELASTPFLALAPKPPQTPGLFAYKTDPSYDGMAALDWFDPTPNSELSAELWCGNLSPGLTHAAKFSPNSENLGQRILLGDCATQSLTIATVAKQDGWSTHIDDPISIPFPWTGLYSSNLANTAIAYNSSSGEILQLNCQGASLKPSDHAVEFIKGLDSMCISHSGFVVGVQQDGSGSKLLGFQNWSADNAWEHRLDSISKPYVAFLPGDVSLVVVSEGAWETLTLNDDGLSGLNSGNWNPDFSVFVVFTLNETHHCLGYDPTTGQVEVIRLDTGDSVWQFCWSLGWDLQICLQF